MKVRNFEPKDYETLKRFHEESGLNYKLPELLIKNSTGELVKHPLFLSLKVLEDGQGNVHAIQGARMQVEMYMWTEKSPWAHPTCKMDYIKWLDQCVRLECWQKGINEAVCYISPQIKKFVKRLVDWLGYQHPRSGWVPLSRPTEETK